MNDKTLPKLLQQIAASYPEVVAQYSKTPDGSFASVTFAEYCSAALDFAGALLSIGCSRGDHVGLISDNRKEWPYASMGIMAIGAADVPRGCDATEREISYILSFVGCRVAVLENSAQLAKILRCSSSLPELKTLILIDEPSEADAQAARDSPFELLSFADCIRAGKAWREANPGAVEKEMEKGTSCETATIIFTSGTTGEPKGVILSHDNFLSQLEELPERIPLNPGDRALSVLPVWHAFERLVEYVILNSAAGIVYSKPVGSVLLDDIAKMNPQLIPSVPRIWEAVYDGIYRAMRKKGGITWVLFRFFIAVALADGACSRAVLGNGPRLAKSRLPLQAAAAIPWILLKPLYALGSVLVYSKIRARLGNAFRGGVSGGGALPPAIDAFFWALKICVVEGYGLTETAPVVAVRPIPKPVFGTIGTPISCCSVKIAGEGGEELPAGQLGTVMVKGRNVMKGYYRRPDLTAAVLSDDGWLDTGDLGLKTLDGEIILRGRKKDTIVLRGGENVEPLPIEMKINESRFILASMVIGQDQKCLSALVVPSEVEVMAWAEENGISGDYKAVLSHAETKRLIEKEIAESVSAKNGFKPFELVNRIALIQKPFEPGVELSAKQEIMRFKILEIYSREVKELFG